MEKLKYFPYKTNYVQLLKQAHKEGRVKFANLVQEKAVDFWDQVMFSDEKLLDEKTRPNTQNEMYCAYLDPEGEVDCKEQEGKKIMCWSTWLKKFVWPKIRSVSTRKSYYFQQDGATCHTTIMVRELQRRKFGQRIISRFDNRPWPSTQSAWVS